MCVQIVEVAVDPETGQVSLRKVTTAHDVGTIINPLLASGSDRGRHRDGRGVRNDGRECRSRTEGSPSPTWVTTRFRRSGMFRCCKRRSSGRPTEAAPYGSMSIGETPVIPFAAALANAVADAVRNTRDIPSGYGRKGVRRDPRPRLRRRRGCRNRDLPGSKGHLADSGARCGRRRARCRRPWDCSRLAVARESEKCGERVRCIMVESRPGAGTCRMALSSG